MSNQNQQQQQQQQQQQPLSQICPHCSAVVPTSKMGMGNHLKTMSCAVARVRTGRYSLYKTFTVKQLRHPVSGRRIDFVVQKLKNRIDSLCCVVCLACGQSETNRVGQQHTTDAALFRSHEACFMRDDDRGASDAAAGGGAAAASSLSQQQPQQQQQEQQSAPPLPDDTFTCQFCTTVFTVREQMLQHQRSLQCVVMRVRGGERGNTLPRNMTVRTVTDPASRGSIVFVQEEVNPRFHVVCLVCGESPTKVLHPNNITDAELVRRHASCFARVTGNDADGAAASSSAPSRANNPKPRCRHCGDQLPRNQTTGHVWMKCVLRRARNGERQNLPPGFAVQSFDGLSFVQRTLPNGNVIYCCLCCGAGESQQWLPAQATSATLLALHAPCVASVGGAVADASPAAQQQQQQQQQQQRLCQYCDEPLPPWLARGEHESSMRCILARARRGQRDNFPHNFAVRNVRSLVFLQREVRGDRLVAVCLHCGKGQGTPLLPEQATDDALLAAHAACEAAGGGAAGGGAAATVQEDAPANGGGDGREVE